MKNKKLIIAGGTGFIGQELIRYFGKNNYVVVLTRQQKHAVNNRNRYNSLSVAETASVKFVGWDGKNRGAWTEELEKADLIINLAGRSVNCRYNERNKKEILESRVNATQVIGDAIRSCKNPPLLWINASSATIYRHALDRPQDEFNGEIENDFSVQVCKAWEKTFFDLSTSATRNVALRMAITLGPGGVMIPYFNLLKFGLGGRQGTGRQMYSWIHIEDSCRIIEWINDHESMQGIYNCSAPWPVSNKEFMRLLRKATGHKIGLPAFTWMLKAGAGIIGTEVELVLKSRWVIPTRLIESGYVFKFPKLEEALIDIISKVPRRQYYLF